MDDDQNQTSQVPDDQTDPAAKDIIAQQGVDPSEVETEDRAELQKDLTDQVQTGGGGGDSQAESPPSDQADETAGSDQPASEDDDSSRDNNN